MEYLGLIPSFGFLNTQALEFSIHGSSDLVPTSHIWDLAWVPIYPWPHAASPVLDGHLKSEPVCGYLLNLPSLSVFLFPSPFSFSNKYEKRERNYKNSRGNGQDFFKNPVKSSVWFLIHYTVIMCLCVCVILIAEHYKKKLLIVDVPLCCWYFEINTH